MNISCIIPAYNEEKRVANVVRAVRGHAHVDEIIVVNDGSTDKTREVLEQEEGIHLISYEKNRGKSAAVMLGLKQAKNDLVMLMDADLVGVTHQNISDLIEPVVHGEADMTLTMRKNSMGIYKLLGIDFVSGERVFHKKIIGDLDVLLKLNSYGLEVFLNNILINNQLKFKVVHWDNVLLILKQEKIGRWKGYKGDFYMIRQIISTIGFGDMIYQLFKMRQLMIKTPTQPRVIR